MQLVELRRQQIPRYTRDDTDARAFRGYQQLIEVVYGTQHEGRRRHQRAADHAHPRGVRREASVREVSRGGRARSAPHVPELAGLRDRRGTASDACFRPRCDAGAGTFAAGHGTRTERAGRHRQRRAPQRHLVAHVRLRRHASQDHHPSRGAGCFGSARARRAHRVDRPRADRRADSRHRRRVPRRQHGLSRALRSRLAHHRIDRHARRRGGVRALVVARRRQDDDGARDRGIAARGRARTVRLDEQAVPSRGRGARGTYVRA